MNTTDRILVLGAGPVGLAMAKAMGEAGVPYAHVEATDHVGGNWAHGVYETAHIISSRRTTEYSDHPMPADWPDFPSAAQMRAYYDDYADTFDLRRHIRFHTEVTAVRQRPDGRWSVAFADGALEVYKGVAVCNGHHWQRSLPPWTRGAGVEVLHSKDYKRPDQLRGRRVLVVGGGNSGCDVVSEAARVGASADWSLRRGYWFLPKTFFGHPTVELVPAWMPVPAQRAVLRALLKVTVGPYTAYGLPEPDHRIFDHHPTVSTEVFHYLTHGRIRPRPDVREVVGDRVVFTDGSEGVYDLIVCATGFDVAFPFLEPGTVEVRDKTPQLIGGAVTRAHRHLYVVGAYQPRYGLGPLVRPFAVLLAQLMRAQEETETPIGEVLHSLGVRPPPTHLVDPHVALRQTAWAMRMLPLIRWQARRMRGKPDRVPAAV